MRESPSIEARTQNASISMAIESDKYRDKATIILDRLDSVWKDVGKNACRIDIMKIDIEGHENYCLKGGQQVIRTDRPIILMEINKLYYVIRGAELDDTFFPLIPESYLVYRRKDKTAFQNINSFNECEDIEDVFLVPEEKLDKFLGSIRGF